MRARVASAALVATSILAYLTAGAGPLAANFAPASVTEHARVAATLARAIPREAGVSASSSLVPRVSHRERVYVFPAVEDAEYVFLDVTASPAPTSAGEVFLRARSLLAGGGWSVEAANDGLLLLARAPGAEPLAVEDLPAEFYTFLDGAGDQVGHGEAATQGHGGETLPPSPPHPELVEGPRSPAPPLSGLELLDAALLASPEGALGPDGPRGVLRTVWREDRPLPEGLRPEFLLTLRTGEQVRIWDLAALWWHPPHRWAPGERVRIDVPDIPLRRLAGWTTIVPTPGDRAVRLGELTLAVQADPWRLRLLDPAGGPVWEEAPDEPLGFRTRDGLLHRATRLLAAEPTGESAVRLVAATDDPAGRTLAVEARGLGPRLFRLTVAPSGPDEVRAVGGAVRAGPDEQFVGFGERFTGVDQRGRLVDVWAEDRVLAHHGESTYAPLPLLLSSKGHGFTLERFERARFDLAASQPDRWSWEQEAPAASVLVSYGPSLKELVQRNAEATGLPPLPPLWAFGAWKTATGGQEHVLGEARRLRELGVPISAIYAYDAMDEAANIGWPSVNFAGRQAGPYPDHAAFTDALHRLGLKATTYLTADFHLDRPGYQEPASRGFFVRDAAGEPYLHPGFRLSWLDPSNPDAVGWWSGLWRRALVDLGYDGGMLDLGELIPPDALLADGSPGVEAHNRYPLLYARAAWEAAATARPDGDFVLFTRSGALGAPRFQSLQWPGDARMRWEAPDGLRSLVPAALSFGLSGFPYWHAEVAGYVQAGLTRDQERELWLRWLQLATWSAALRDQYGDHPTDPVDFWLDDGTIAAYRDAARVHNSLLPYLYTLAAEAHRTGLPLMRFLPLEAPDDPRAWREEQSFFLGPSLLVAPVVEPGATTRTVYLPPGDWVDFWTEQPYQGGREVTVPAPLDGGRAPVFARAGALLPLAADFDSLAAGEDASVRTYQGDLVVRVVPGRPGPAEFTLYDGTRLAWDGARTLRVAANARPRTVELRLPGGVAATGRVEGPEGAVGAP